MVGASEFTAALVVKATIAKGLQTIRFAAHPRRVATAFLLGATVTFASVKPNFQLTGTSRSPIYEGNVKVALEFPRDDTRYEVIGLMSDCSGVSDYADFIAVYRATAASYGANCIVVQKSTTKTGGSYTSSRVSGNHISSYSSSGVTNLCVDATAIHVRPEAPQPSPPKEDDCTNYLKELVRLHEVVDSLKAVIVNLVGGK